MIILILAIFTTLIGRLSRMIVVVNIPMRGTDLRSKVSFKESLYGFESLHKLLQLVFWYVGSSKRLTIMVFACRRCRSLVLISTPLRTALMTAIRAIARTVAETSNSTSVKPFLLFKRPEPSVDVKFV